MNREKKSDWYSFLYQRKKIRVFEFMKLPPEKQQEIMTEYEKDKNKRLERLRMRLEMLK